MALPEDPDPVKVFVALLRSQSAELAGVKDRVSRAWGPIDHAGRDHAFTATDYYAAEMGGDLVRCLVSFEPLARPEELVALKLAANAIETELSAGGRRTVNLDIGYFDIHKVVLASGKYEAQKVHLGRGIYADLVARYSEGSYRPYEWTFPDFRQRLYDDDLVAIRGLYKAQLRELRVDSRQLRVDSRERREEKSDQSS